MEFTLSLSAYNKLLVRNAMNLTSLFHIAYQNPSSNILQPFSSFMDKFSPTICMIEGYIHYNPLTIFFNTMNKFASTVIPTYS